MNRNQQPIESQRNRVRSAIREYIDQYAKLARGIRALENPTTGSEILDSIAATGQLLPSISILEKYGNVAAHAATAIPLKQARGEVENAIKKTLGRELTQVERDALSKIGAEAFKNVLEGMGNADAAKSAKDSTGNLDFGIGATPTDQDMDIPASQEEVRANQEQKPHSTPNEATNDIENPESSNGSKEPGSNNHQQNPADAAAGIPDQRPQSGTGSEHFGNKQNPDDQSEAPTGGGNDTDTASAPAGDASVATEVPAPQGFISDEEAERMGALIEAPLDRDEEVALKKPEDLTEAEIRRIARRGAYGTPGHRDFTRLNDLVKDWHEIHYSTEPLRHDWTGRMIPPDFVKQPPTQEVDPKEATGVPMTEARKTLA